MLTSSQRPQWTNNDLTDGRAISSRYDDGLARQAALRCRRRARGWRGMPRHGTDLEHADDLRQPGRLLVHGLRRRRSLLDQGRVLLRHVIHLDDGLIDLLDAGALLR